MRGLLKASFGSPSQCSSEDFMISKASFCLANRAGLTFAAYIIYMISLPCNLVYSKLKTLRRKGLIEQMRELFRNPPMMTMKADCYHISASGNMRHSYTGPERAYTHHAAENVWYHSTRDISGLFNLNLNADEAKTKRFVLLSLRKEVHFAESIGFADFITQKELFWQANRYRNKRMVYNEERLIEGFEESLMVQIDDH